LIKNETKEYERMPKEYERMPKEYERMPKENERMPKEYERILLLNDTSLNMSVSVCRSIHVAELSKS